LSLEALRWMHELHIAFVQIGADGDVIATGAPNAIKDVRVRRGQALARYSEAGLATMRELLVEKVSGQCRVLELIEDAEGKRLIALEALDRLRVARTVEDLRLFESIAAQAYWTAWEHIPLHFAGRDAQNIPDHWLSFGTRKSLLTSTPRKAASPGNAILNYLYAILEAEARLAAVAVGCDPGMGVVHIDTRTRDSFACDLMEPARPVVDLYVLKLLGSQTFRRTDFFELRDGNCRIMPELSRPLAATSNEWRKAIAPWAEQLAGRFLNLPLTLSANGGAGRIAEPPRHRTPLTGRNRSRVSISQRKPTRPGIAKLPSRCTMCGAELGHSSRKYCDACLPIHTQSKLSGARAHQLKLRETGEDQRSSPENRAKRSAVTRRQNAITRAWKAKNPEAPNLQAFHNEIWPSLKGMSLSRLVAASGLSRSACQKIRAGTLVPHPRHWERLKAIT
jgi:CRISPR-associated endonuclease Cas1